MTHSSDTSFETASLSGTHWLAIVLALVTGALHIYAGVVEGRPPLLLAGVGFFGAVVLVLVDFHRNLLYPIGIVYTFVQIPLWYVANAGEFTTLGYVDKVVQIALVLVLASLFWRERQTNADGRESITV